MKLYKIIYYKANKWIPGTSYLIVDNVLTLDIEMETFRKHECTGRPLGDVNIIEKMEVLLDLKLKPQKPGQKK